ncbi:MAG: DnaD domain protein [Bacillota bacterium]|nr:DnaD domain protein [Bacillota bacterium]
MDKVYDKTTGFHFTIIDNYVLDHKSLNGDEQIIYIHLKKYANSNSECFPGIGTLATNLKWSENTVRKNLKSLEDKGFISIEHRFDGQKYKSNLYTLLPYPEYVEEEEVKQDTTAAEEPKETVKGIGDVIKVYQNNINPVCGSMERDELIKWFETFEDNADVIIKAIEVAVHENVRKIKYINSILADWNSQGIKTLGQAEAYTSQRNHKVKKGGDKVGGTRATNTKDTAEIIDFGKLGG